MFGELAPPRRAGSAMIYTGRVGRTGPLKYPWGVERRDDRELQSIIPQLAGKPITWLHPAGTIRGGAEAKVVGRIVRGWIDGDFAAAELRIDDAKARRGIAEGTRELSLGYTVDIVGGFQRNTEIDHLAIVPVARCGPACVIRADATACCEPCREGLTWYAACSTKGVGIDSAKRAVLNGAHKLARNRNGK